MKELIIKLGSIKIANAHDTIRCSGIFGSSKPGTLVAVRPCADKFKGKTYLGMYLCDAPTSVHGIERDGEVTLVMNDYTNPAIYIPEVDEIVWGYGSWWGSIKDENELKQITDADIQNVWYVKALKQLQERKAGEEEVED